MPNRFFTFQGFSDIFGDVFAPSYLTTDEEGDEVLIPPSELAEKIRNESGVDLEIEPVNVEYGLDGCHEFYQNGDPC